MHTIDEKLVVLYNCVKNIVKSYDEDE